MQKNLFSRTGIKRVVVLLGISSLAITSAGLPMASAKNPVNIKTATMKPVTMKPVTMKPVTIIRGQAPRIVSQNLTTQATLPAESGKVDNLQNALINLAAQSNKSDNAARPNKEDLLRNLLGKARGLMGVPYRLGGNNPDKALDCSAYVQLVFHQVGIELPRSTYGQIKMGQPLDYAELRPGDLVFFSSDGPGPTHVGIYIGNGQMINETPPKVEIDTIIKADGSKTFYGRTYFSARRVLPE